MFGWITITYIQKFGLFDIDYLAILLRQKGTTPLLTFLSTFSWIYDIVSTVKYFWNQVDFWKVNDMIFLSKFSNFTSILFTKVTLQAQKAQIRLTANGLDAEADSR